MHRMPPTKLRQTFLLFVAAILIVGAILIYTVAKRPLPSERGTHCSADAQLCPDGSYVIRTGPNCEFADCPSI